jgi:hypothetical protein
MAVRVSATAMVRARESASQEDYQSGSEAVAVEVKARVAQRHPAEERLQWSQAQVAALLPRTA